MGVSTTPSRRAYLSNNVHCEIAHWKQLYQSMKARPTCLVEIVHRLAMDLGFVDASGLSAGCVWLDPNSNEEHSVWRVEWPPDVVTDLVNCDKSKGRITNSNLELAAIVVQEATSPLIYTDPAWLAPSSGSDNTPMVAWTFKEASTINPVVADLLCIRSILNYQSTISPSFVYHPGLRNTMIDDALRRFDFNCDSFLSFYTYTYQPQSPGSWTLCHLSKEVISSLVCALRKQPFTGAMYQTPIHQHYISTGFTSTLTSALATSHRLQDSEVLAIKLLQVYGHRIRHGRYSRQDSVRVDSVTMVWYAIAKTYLLEGHPDPRNPQDSSSKDLDKQLTRQLWHYSYQDPLSKREKEPPHLDLSSKLLQL